MLLTVTAAAHRLGIGYSTLKQWIYAGKVRTTTTAGGHHRIADAEIDRLIARGSLPTGTLAGRSSEDVAVARSRNEPGLIVGLSGRNKLRGYVDEVRVDGLLAQVRLRIGDQILTAVVTADAIAELKLKRGDDAVAIVKSTEVMVAREAAGPLTLRPGPPAGRPRRPRR
jgi:molybdopterin-binding protein